MEENNLKDKTQHKAYFLKTLCQQINRTYSPIEKLAKHTIRYYKWLLNKCKLIHVREIQNKTIIISHCSSLSVWQRRNKLAIILCWQKAGESYVDRNVNW